MLLWLRPAAAVASRAGDVVARLDDCSSFGAGAFLNAIPRGRERSGRYSLRPDLWVIAARAHIGLTPPGVVPGDICGLCHRPLDSGVEGQSVCCGSLSGSCSRAAIHASVCPIGGFKNRRHNSTADVLCEMWEAIGGTAAADHRKARNSRGVDVVGNTCMLPSGNQVDLILYGAGRHGGDIAIDVSFVCVEASNSKFETAIAKREADKNTKYLEECKSLGLEFYPFVLGAHGGFGKSARSLFKVLVGLAKKLEARDWRHSWTAMSYEACWLQKLSIVIARESAIGALCRVPVFTRNVVLGEDAGGDWTVGRSGGGVER